jgi:hypothetical protein
MTLFLAVLALVTSYRIWNAPAWRTREPDFSDFLKQNEPELVEFLSQFGIHLLEFVERAVHSHLFVLRKTAGNGALGRYGMLSRGLGNLAWAWLWLGQGLVPVAPRVQVRRAAVIEGVRRLLGFAHVRG